MNYKTLLSSTAFLIVALVVVFSYLKTSQNDLVQISVSDEVKFASTTKNLTNNDTSNWKTFINERDGYMVKYPGEEISGKPVIGSMVGELKKYGFLSSLTFQKYGGWASIHIYDGQMSDAINASKKIDHENRIYKSEQDAEIGGVTGRVLVWTNKLDTKKMENKSYFVQDSNRPDVTLYISGIEDFVKSIKFIDLKKYSLEAKFLGEDRYTTPSYMVYVKNSRTNEEKNIGEYRLDCSDPMGIDISNEVNYEVSRRSCWWGGYGKLFAIDFKDGIYSVLSKDLDSQSGNGSFETVFELQ